MAKMLKKKGFNVLYLEDSSLKKIKNIVRKFSSKLKDSGVGFFYYAGHGV